MFNFSLIFILYISLIEITEDSDENLETVNTTIWKDSRCDSNEKMNNK